jgi:hypothetical protein
MACTIAATRFLQRCAAEPLKLHVVEIIDLAAYAHAPVELPLPPLLPPYRLRRVLLLQRPHHRAPRQVRRRVLSIQRQRRIKVLVRPRQISHPLPSVAPVQQQGPLRSTWDQPVKLLSLAQHPDSLLVMPLPKVRQPQPRRRSRLDHQLLLTGTR